MFCRNCGANMVQGSQVCQGCRTPLGIGCNFCPNCGTHTNPNDYVCPNCNATLNNANYYAQQTCPHSRIVAGILGILLGYLGIHNFYLGFTNKAVAQVLLSTVGAIFTCGISAVAAWIWAVVESIQILTGVVNVDARGIPLKD